MNSLMIIGTLGKDPELRTTQSGIAVCSFSLAVNEHKGEEKVTTWFRVTAWRKLAENCNRYLFKGSKAAVKGSVTMSSYTAKDGTTKASMEVSADEVEFLSPREPVDDAVIQPTDEKKGFVAVDLGDDLPF